MKNYVCLFSVEYINIDNETKTEYGLIYADDFRDAMNQLEGHMYGDDLVKIGVQKGRQLGQILDTLLFEVINQNIHNDKETLLKFAKQNLIKE